MGARNARMVENIKDDLAILYTKCTFKYAEEKINHVRDVAREYEWLLSKDYMEDLSL